MNLQLGGKRALVTGGSRGIGKAAARRLAEEGADVVIAARTAADLEQSAAEMSAATGRRIVSIACDTRSDAGVVALVAEAAEAFGGLDILVNAAATPGGQATPPRLAEVTGALLFEDVDVKVMGYLRCAREAAPLMAAQGWGRIINVSGLAARQTGSIIGSIRNVAVAAMTKNLADELGPRGINVTCVHPGLTRTERTGPRVAELAARWGVTPGEAEARMAGNVVIGRLVDAAEVADVICFLASPRSAAITGDAIACGGGARGSIYY
jgi:NAD(P)-dependent dehydrogenase (short-subunit alcohol dehydrogenase family)